MVCVVVEDVEVAAVCVDVAVSDVAPPLCEPAIAQPPRAPIIMPAIKMLAYVPVYDFFSGVLGVVARGTGVNGGGTGVVVCAGTTGCDHESEDF